MLIFPTEIDMQSKQAVNVVDEDFFKSMTSIFCSGNLPPRFGI